MLFTAQLSHAIWIIVEQSMSWSMRKGNGYYTLISRTKYPFMSCYYVYVGIFQNRQILLPLLWPLDMRYKGDRNTNTTYLLYQYIFSVAMDKYVKRKCRNSEKKGGMWLILLQWQRSCWDIRLLDTGVWYVCLWVGFINKHTCFEMNDDDSDDESEHYVVVRHRRSLTWTRSSSKDTLVMYRLMYQSSHIVLP